MPLSVHELSDRLEINDLFVRYAYCIDTGDFDGLDDVFSADAVIDYTATGGPRGTLPEIKEFLTKAMALFRSSQHMISNSAVVLNGDTAEARTMCHNPMELRVPAGTPSQVLFCGFWYLDELVRTEGGWRIRRRSEEKSYMHTSRGAAVS